MTEWITAQFTRAWSTPSGRVRGNVDERPWGRQNRTALLRSGRTDDKFPAAVDAGPRAASRISHP